MGYPEIQDTAALPILPNHTPNPPPFHPASLSSSALEIDPDLGLLSCRSHYSPLLMCCGLASLHGRDCKSLLEWFYPRVVHCLFPSVALPCFNELWTWYCQQSPGCLMMATGDNYSSVCPEPPACLWPRLGQCQLGQCQQHGWAVAEM